MGLVIRLVLVPVGSFSQDANTMRSWAVRLATQPLSEFYSRGNLTDHLPGDLWFLWLIAHMYRIFSPDLQVQGLGFLFLLKLVPALADVGIGLLLFLLGRKFGGHRTGLLAAAFFLLNPASIFLTAVWGQWDPVSAFFALVALWLLLGANAEWSLPVLTYAAVIKPPFAGLAPLFALAFMVRYILSHMRWAAGAPVLEPLGRSLRRAAVAVTGSVFVLLAVTLPFNVGLPGMGTRHTIFGRLQYALDVYPYTTLNAFTLWGTPIGGNWKPDELPFLLGLPYQTWGTLLLLAAYAFILYTYLRRRSDAALLWSCLATTFALFMLPTRGHERYLFPTVVFACLIAAIAPRLRWLGAALSLTFLANLYWVYDYYNPALELQDLFSLGSVVAAGALINVFLLDYVFAFAPRQMRLSEAPVDGVPNRGSKRPQGRRAESRSQLTVPIPAAESSRPWVTRYGLPVLIFTVALVLFLPRTGSVGRYYFDDVYHAYTAGQYVQGDAAAYIGRGEPPQRPEINKNKTYYEWTHPPLGKLLIADGILLAGDNPVGWRVASVVFGAMGVVLLYLLALALAGSRTAAFIAAGLLMLDGLYFVESRTGKVDIFVLVFATAALLGLYKYLVSPPDRVRAPLIWTGLMMGLGIATKWNAIYAAAIIGLVAMWRTYRLWQQSRGGRPSAEVTAGLRQHLAWVPLALIILPLGVYLLSYVPSLLAGHSVADMVELQARMLRYHTGLVGTHPYKSRWWTWPLNLRPVLYYFNGSGTSVSAIYARGNVMLYWAFLPAVVWLAIRWWDTNRAAFTVLLAGFFGQWLPWAFSPRSSYLYHFLPAVPFGCLAIAVLITEAWRGGRGRLLVAAYMTLVLQTFLYFYPIYSALPLTGREFDARIWFRGWR